ncbi:hypothetical protein [Streptomyces achromogenes]|uniref:hypothetical protein n=1 Tax=Streptomyces achromogenes TaxID=67255 RepID=UPI0036FBF0FA
MPAAKPSETSAEPAFPAAEADCAASARLDGLLTAEVLVDAGLVRRATAVARRLARRGAVCDYREQGQAISVSTGWV